MGNFVSYQQDSYNLTLRRSDVTIFDVEKQ